MSTNDNHVYVRSQTEFEYLKRKRRENMRTQVTTFSIMIFLTLISFTAVVADFSKYYIIPIILLLAAVQVALQLYYFMHMSEKNHNLPAYFIYFAAMVGFTFLLTFVTIVWW